MNKKVKYKEGLLEKEETDLYKKIVTFYVEVQKIQGQVPKDQTEPYIRKFFVSKLFDLSLKSSKNFCSEKLEHLEVTGMMVTKFIKNIGDFFKEIPALIEEWEANIKKPKKEQPVPYARIVSNLSKLNEYTEIEKLFDDWKKVIDATLLVKQKPAPDDSKVGKPRYIWQKRGRLLYLDGTEASIPLGIISKFEIPDKYWYVSKSGIPNNRIKYPSAIYTERKRLIPLAMEVRPLSICKVDLPSSEESIEKEKRRARQRAVWEKKRREHEELEKQGKRKPDLEYFGAKVNVRMKEPSTVNIRAEQDRYFDIRKNFIAGSHSNALLADEINISKLFRKKKKTSAASNSNAQSSKRNPKWESKFLAVNSIEFKKGIADYHRIISVGLSAK